MTGLGDDQARTQRGDRRLHKHFRRLAWIAAIGFGTAVGNCQVSVPGPDNVTFQSARDALDPGPARFAAHVGYYPAGVFGAIVGPAAYTGAPVLMLLGDKDDNLPVVKVWITWPTPAAGFPAPVESEVYPDAYQAWTVPGLTTLRFYGEYGRARRRGRRSQLGQPGPHYSSTASWRPLIPPVSAPAWPKLQAIPWSMTALAGRLTARSRCACRCRTA